MPLRVLIVADVRLYRDGLATTLAGRARFEIVGTAATRAGAIAAAVSLRPDIAIVDMAVPDALNLIRDFRMSSGAAVVAFAVDEVAADILSCAQAGAAGYVTADASLDDLAAALEGAAAGELRCSPKIAGELFRSFAQTAAERAFTANPFLTSRERDVLNLLREGLSNKEIGRHLNLAESTVKNHVHHILEKLNVRTRAQAAIQTTGRRQLGADHDKLRTG